MKKQASKKAALSPERAERVTKKADNLEVTTTRLLGDIRALIDQSRSFVAQTVNSTLVTLYWHIGKKIGTEVLGQKRADYGEKIIVTLSQQLTAEYGRGFAERSLRHMLRFAEAFPDDAIVSALRRDLGWTHFKRLIYFDDKLKRDFYAEMCRIEKWSTRTLDKKIGGMLYERTAIARKPEKVVANELALLRDTDTMTPDLVFRDPYVLDFLGLPQEYSEKDLENAILREIEKFLLELGTDFTFVARQKRMSIGKEDFYLDLLFYHRGLRRLIAIDLKLEHFTAAYKGQMELYLRWLDKHERRTGEESPLGLILCSENDPEQIELLELNQSGIRVAEYLTELPPRALLEAKLNEAIKFSRAQIRETQND